jgi:hypothetical protein
MDLLPFVDPGPLYGPSLLHFRAKPPELTCSPVRGEFSNRQTFHPGPLQTSFICTTYRTPMICAHISFLHHEPHSYAPLPVAMHALTPIMNLAHITLRARKLVSACVCGRKPQRCTMAHSAAHPLVSIGLPTLRMCRFRSELRGWMRSNASFCDSGAFIASLTATQQRRSAFPGASKRSRTVKGSEAPPEMRRQK